MDLQSYPIADTWFSITKVDDTTDMLLEPHVHVLEHAQPGSEISWQGELLVIVSAETEGAAAEGVDALKLEYEQLDVFTSEQDLEAAQEAGRGSTILGFLFGYL